MNKKRCNTLLPLVQLLPAVAAAAAVLFPPTVFTPQSGKINIADNIKNPEHSIFFIAILIFP